MAAEVFMFLMRDRQMFFTTNEHKDFYRVERQDDDGYYVVDLVDQKGQLKKMLDVAETMPDAEGVMKAHQHDIQEHGRFEHMVPTYRLKADKNYGKQRKVYR